MQCFSKSWWPLPGSCNSSASSTRLRLPPKKAARLQHVVVCLFVFVDLKQTKKGKQQKYVSMSGSFFCGVYCFVLFFLMFVSCVEHVLLKRLTGSFRHEHPTRGAGTTLRIRNFDFGVGSGCQCCFVVFVFVSIFFGMFEISPTVLGIKLSYLPFTVFTDSVSSLLQPCHQHGVSLSVNRSSPRRLLMLRRLLGPRIAELPAGRCFEE